MVLNFYRKNFLQTAMSENHIEIIPILLFEHNSQGSELL